MVWRQERRMTTLLDVRGLRVRLPSPNGPITIVDGIDFSVLRGQVLGIAGESGSGKSISALALLGLTPVDAVVEGSAVFGNADLLSMSQHQLRDIRGRLVAMVFQDPMTSLHPMMTVERQLTEHARHHLKLSRHDARDRALELLGEVRIPDPARALGGYPHQFSGGMRQRIAIAMALMCRPQLLIADEPTTALDVTVQASILRLIDRLRERFDLSVILITHDLGVMSSLADELTIFYAGRVVESGPTRAVLRYPRHPYTAGLLASLPHPELSEVTPLVSIAGSSPSPSRRPTGCAFHPRCVFALGSCVVNVPPLVPIQARDNRELACPVDPLARFD
jgi:oligopeptide transport system ATP-binding protein